jgi:hypothetical protein
VRAHACERMRLQSTIEMHHHDHVSCIATQCRGDSHGIVEECFCINMRATGECMATQLVMGRFAFKRTHAFHAWSIANAPVQECHEGSAVDHVWCRARMHVHSMCTIHHSMLEQTMHSTALHAPPSPPAATVFSDHSLSRE